MKERVENIRSNRFIYTFDIFGQSLNLHLFGNEKYKTLTGGIFGLISLLLIIAVNIYFLLDVLNRKTMTIVFNEDNSKIPMNNLSDIPIMMTLTDTSGKPLKSEGLISLDVKMLNYKRYDTGNGTTQFRLEVLPLQVEQCNFSKHFSDFPEFFTKFRVEYFYCIPPGKYNITIFGRYGDTLNGWSNLAIYVNKCNAKLGQTCFNQTYIEAALSNPVLNVNMLSYGINHYNFSSPNSYKLDTAVFPLSSTLLKSYNYMIRQVLYNTDIGFVLEDQQTEQFYTYHSQTVDVDLNSNVYLKSDNSIGYLIIRNFDTISNYYRAYMKVQTMMASIGGLVKSIMVIFQIICHLIIRKMMFLDISNQIFHYNLNEEPSIKPIKINNVELVNSNPVNHGEKLKINISPIENLSFKSDNNFSNSQTPRKLNKNFRKSYVVVTDKISEIKLSAMEFICPMWCIKFKKNLELLEKSKSVLIKKISVENMIEKFFKVDHVAHMVLTDNQIKEYNFGERVLFDDMKTFAIHKKTVDKEKEESMSNITRTVDLSSARNMIKKNDT